MRAAGRKPEPEIGLNEIDLFGFSIRSYQGPTAPTLAVGPAAQFLMFTGGGGAARAGGPPAPPRAASINHGCFSMDGFKPDDVLKSLESYGLKPREGTQGQALNMNSNLINNVATPVSAADAATVSYELARKRDGGGRLL